MEKQVFNSTFIAAMNTKENFMGNYYECYDFDYELAMEFINFYFLNSDLFFS